MVFTKSDLSLSKKLTDVPVGATIRFEACEVFANVCVPIVIALVLLLLQPPPPPQEARSTIEIESNTFRMAVP
jgi:hypothetical protein